MEVMAVAALASIAIHALFTRLLPQRCQRAAVISNGEIRAVPRIMSPVRNEMILTPDRTEKVSAVHDAVN